MSYGVMRPGFNTLVGQVMFQICENWIGFVECGGVFGALIVILFIEIQKNDYLS